MLLYLYRFLILEATLEIYILTERSFLRGKPASGLLSAVMEAFLLPFWVAF